MFLVLVVMMARQQPQLLVVLQTILIIGQTDLTKQFRDLLAMLVVFRLVLLVLLLLIILDVRQPAQQL
jgi:hypothetical protein